MIEENMNRMAVAQERIADLLEKLMLLQESAVTFHPSEPAENAEVVATAEAIAPAEKPRRGRPKKETVDAAAPTTPEAAPTVDEAAPAVDEAAPATSADAPAVDEAAPAVEDLQRLAAAALKQHSREVVLDIIGKINPEKKNISSMDDGQRRRMLVALLGLSEKGFE